MTHVELTTRMWSGIRQEFPALRQPIGNGEQVDFRIPEIEQWFERRWHARYNHFYTDASPARSLQFTDPKLALEFVLRYG